MNISEYRTMYEVEEVHWWYRGLRAMIGNNWRRFNKVSEPGVLDVGCGTGANIKHLNENTTTVGLDISVDALVFCRERGIKRLLRGTVERLPFRDGIYDGALLMDVLYHRAVSDKAGALRETARVVKPGGLILINVPAYQWLLSSHDAAIHTDKRFTRHELKTIIESAGLVVERITYWNTFLFLPAALVRMARKNGDEKHGSDLEGYTPTFVTEILESVLKFECRLMGLVPLPFGLSIFAVARKPY